MPLAWQHHLRYSGSRMGSEGYGNAGYHDIFYLVRLELQFPPSSVPLPHPSPPVARRLEAAGFPFWDNLLASPLTRPASISSAGTGSPVAPAKSPRQRSNSSSTSAPARSAISARTAYKIPGALLALEPQPSKVAISSRSAYKIPGALINPPPDEMPFDSKKAGKALGKALGKPFTAMYASGGEFPISISTPADARMQAFGELQPRLGKEREREKYEEREDGKKKGRDSPSKAPVRPTTSKSEQDTPAQVMRAPQYPPVPPPSERHSPLLTVRRPRLDSRPESGLLPRASSAISSGGYQDEKRAIMTSPILGPIDATGHPERRSDTTYTTGKHSSGSQSRSLDDTEDHIRQLFNALPPEAQALAYARLAEQRERERQIVAKREQAMMMEREAEVRIELELREKERARIERERAEQRRQGKHDSADSQGHGHANRNHHADFDIPDRDHYDAYGGAYLSSPAGRMLPPIPTGRRQQSGDSFVLERQASTQRRVPVGIRRRLSPQEEIEEQISQLLEAQTLPPRPPGPPSRHTSLRGRSSASPTGLSYDAPLRTLSDPSAPRSFVPPRPLHAPPHAQPSPRSGPSASPGLPPDRPGSSLDTVESSSQMSTPRSKASGGDTEVRAALAARIRALQAALDTLDVDQDDDVSEILGSDHLPASQLGDLHPFPSPPTQMPNIPRKQWRAGSPEDTLPRPVPTPTPSGLMNGAPEDLLPRPGAPEDLFPRPATHTPSASLSHPGPRGASLQRAGSTPRAVAPHDVLQLDDLPAPQPRVANVSPLSIGHHLPEEDPCSRPSSELGGDHFMLDSYDRRGYRQTPPPEYATVGPQLSVRLLPLAIDTNALF